MAKKKAAAPEPAGESAPMWIVSFADLVTLLMSFFVVLYALKQGGDQQQIETTAAIKKTFGYIPPEDSMDPVDMLINQQLGRPLPPMSKNAGRSSDPLQGADGVNPNVQTMRPGAEVKGGSITFAVGSADIDEVSQKTISRLADVVRGHNNVLIVKGHASNDELSLAPDDLNRMALCYRRASAVCDQLVKLGIDRRVLRPAACGPFEPVKQQAYGSDALRANRRVEIFSTDTTINDYNQENVVPDVRGSDTKPAAGGGAAEEKAAAKVEAAPKP